LAKVLCAAGISPLSWVLAPPEAGPVAGQRHRHHQSCRSGDNRCRRSFERGTPRRADVLEDRYGLCLPKVVAFLGMQAYRLAFRRPRAAVGLQGETLGPASVWLLPNPSGLQAAGTSCPNWSRCLGNSTGSRWRADRERDWRRGPRAPVASPAAQLGTENGVVIGRPRRIDDVPGPSFVGHAWPVTIPGFTSGFQR